MWEKKYKDYKPDEPIIKYQVRPGHGIIGCEMHDVNGWGLESHIPKNKRNTGLIYLLFSYLGFK